MNKRFWAGLWLCVCCRAAFGDALPGKWIGGTLGAGTDAALEYKLYVPSGYRQAPMPLVVMLHGCLQGPDSFAESTRMNSYAENGQFLVLYPAQKMSANPARCWNWFVPENQRRDSGEPARIVAAIGEVERQYAVDRKRVYVAGLSAGASMSAVLSACYPDVFAAAAIHDGTMYKSASSLMEAEKVMLRGATSDPAVLGAEAWACGGKPHLLVPVMVWHGQADKIVNPSNGDGLVREFLTLNDLADNGQRDGSIPQQTLSESATAPGGYGYKLTRYTYRGQPLLEYYQVAEMGHAWSGGKGEVMFSDPKGPDASLLMWNFFRRFTR